MRVVALNAVGGLIEGAGVLALVPLLHALGIGDGSGAVTSGNIPLPVALAGYVALVTVAALTMRASSMAVQTLTLDFLDHLRAGLHAAILVMEWRQFRSLRVAELQQTITGEIGRIGYAVSLLTVLAGVVLTMPFVLGASLVLSLPLTLAALAVAGVVVLLTRRLGAEGFRLGRDLGVVNRAAVADLADDLAGLRIVKSFAAEATRAAAAAAPKLRNTLRLIGVSATNGTGAAARARLDTIDAIANNLRLAGPDADDDALWQAHEAAAVADFVRALLRRPSLLVLDEATASLDGETETVVARPLACGPPASRRSPRGTWTGQRQLSFATSQNVPLSLRSHPPCCD